MQENGLWQVQVDYKDKVVVILVVGLMLILFTIVIFDFTIALEVGRPPDDGVIELLKMSITGLVGIVSGYLAGRNSNVENNDDENNC